MAAIGVKSRWHALPRVLEMGRGRICGRFDSDAVIEASHIHDDIPKPEFKRRQSRRARAVLSTFAAILSALVWLLVQKLD